ncbi:MAG: hypothetical protein K9G80_03160 [Candidatus Nanopelagicales bacterium]|nr:hypothetical protein [Candidatus Nanopelagicales bacterium]MCF8537601.1 hypothetical protein [Candidatus Nanopelagicales bacterium]MCF8557962.1 hypothetical protein [Candidatus Nanopelagicales bacterium]
MARVQFRASALVIAGIVGMVGIANEFAPSDHPFGLAYPYVIAVLSLVAFAVIAPKVTGTQAQVAYAVTAVLCLAPLAIAYAARPTNGQLVFSYLLALSLVGLPISYPPLFAGWFLLILVDLAVIRPFFGLS